jgi:putative phosphoribosyl transferase
LFANRIEAGKRLASALSDFAGTKGVVLAIPRGGVVVGFEIVRALSFVLDVIVPRKIRAPDNPELAIGAVTEDGTMILDQDLVKYLEVSEAYIQKESKYQQSEIKRRIRLYRGNISRISLKNLNVIIVDDGIATGSTMKAALASVRKSGARKVVIAVPVGPSSTIRELENQADQVVCLYTPEPFQAVGEFYEDFSQTTDEEVKKLLKLARQKEIVPESGGESAK